MHVREEAIISISDLRYVCIDCPLCHTKVILDMQQKSAFGEKHGFFAPRKCPGCEVLYDTAIQPSVDALQKAYSALMGIAGRISFRGEAEEAAAKK